MNQYQNLKVWQASRILVKDIYVLVSSFPKEERYGIVDQMKRSAVSIPSNIAE
jgi:four helix bundle protein